MGHQKVKMQQWKEREKGFLRLLSGRKSVHFFGDKILRKMYWKKNLSERKAEKG